MRFSKLLRDKISLTDKRCNWYHHRRFQCKQKLFNHPCSLRIQNFLQLLHNWNCFRRPPSQTGHFVHIPSHPTMGFRDHHLAITMEAITTKAGSRIFLDICAGYQRPLSSSLKKFGCDVCTFDILAHSEDDLLNDNRYELLLRLACSRQVAYSAGSPSCNEYSRLRLRPGGPIALRTPDQLDGIPGLTYDQQLKVQRSATMLSRVVTCLSQRHH